ncbi:MAG: tetratricopeptide (TPR) repeat protein, partial [Kiritimatiellia bacterium]
HSLPDRYVATLYQTRSVLLFSRLGRPRHALDDLQRASALHTSNAIVQLQGQICYALGQRTKSKECYVQALQIARDERDDRATAYALYLLGFQCRTDGQPAEAIRLLDEALQLNDSRSKPRVDGQVLTQIALCHLATGDLKDANNAASKAIHLLDRLGDVQCADEARMALAHVYFRAGSLQDAGDLFDQLAKRATERNRRFEALRESLNLAGVRFMQGRYARAATILDGVYDSLDESLGPLFYYAVPLYRGWSRVLEGRGAEALEYVQQSRDVKADRSSHLLHMCDYIQAWGLRLTGQHQAAREVIDVAIDAFTEQGDAHTTALCRLEQGRLFVATGDLNAAVASFESAAGGLAATGAKLHRVEALCELASIRRDPQLLHTIRQLSGDIVPTPHLRATLDELFADR